MKRTSKPKFSFMVGVGQNTTGPKAPPPAVPKGGKLPEPTETVGKTSTETLVPNKPRE